MPAERTAIVLPETGIRVSYRVKLLGNVAFHPLSALTRATRGQMTTDAGVRAIARSIMTEVEPVANRLGIEPPISIEQKIAGAEMLGVQKTSMLQDLEAQRPMELDSIIGAVVELRRAARHRHGLHTNRYASAKLLETTSALRRVQK